MPADIRNFFGGGARASQGSQGSQKKDEVCQWLFSSERVAYLSHSYHYAYSSSFLLLHADEYTTWRGNQPSYSHFMVDLL
jgi:hypothetical protein